jgi:cleavage and polyadenylation specificity factor subunit 1
MVATFFQKSILSRVIIPKTAIITPFGLFEYLFTPFGLSNSAQTFQRMIDHMVLRTVKHTFSMEAFFHALATIGLAINLKKCIFAIPSLEILGPMISALHRLFSA